MRSESDSRFMSHVLVLFNEKYYRINSSPGWCKLCKGEVQAKKGERENAGKIIDVDVVEARD